MYAVSDVFQMHQIQHTASSFAAQMEWLVKGRLQMAELTYIRVGDYYIPNLVLDPEPAESPRPCLKNKFCIKRENVVS